MRRASKAKIPSDSGCTDNTSEPSQSAKEASLREKKNMFVGWKVFAGQVGASFPHITGCQESLSPHSGEKGERERGEILFLEFRWCVHKMKQRKFKWNRCHRRSIGNSWALTGTRVCLRREREGIIQGGGGGWEDGKGRERDDTSEADFRLALDPCFWKS
jgi:hypothetical protein